MIQRNLNFFNLKIESFYDNYLIIKDDKLLDKINIPAWNNATNKLKILKINEIFKKIPSLRYDNSFDESYVSDIVLFELENYNQMWLDESYYIKILYQNGFLYECIGTTKKNAIFKKCNENINFIYLNYCIQLYKIFCYQSEKEVIYFYGRKFIFTRNKLSIEINNETNKYYIVKIKPDELLDFIKFFEFIKR